MKRFSENEVVLLHVSNVQQVHTVATEPLVVYFEGSCAPCSLEMRQYESQADSSWIVFVDVSDKYT